MIVGASLPLPSCGAQPVYSVNALGYVDANFVAGSNLIANALFAGDNSVSNLFRGVPDGSIFLPYDRGSETFSPTNRFTLGSGWSDPSATFLAPNGGFLWLPKATKISFVGQPWSVIPGPLCLNFSEHEVYGWFPPPNRCGIFDCDCTGSVGQDGDTVLTWNPHTQSYTIATYIDGLGWVPAAPVFGVTDSIHFYVFGSFTARSPFMGTGGPTPQKLPWLNLRNPERNGTNLTFRWPSTSNVNYAVFSSTNLNIVSWQLMQEGTATPAEGVATISISGSNSAAYYRVLPQFGASTVLLGGARGTSNFTFQLYAPAATNYFIQRAPWLNFPTNSSPWQTITNITAGPSNIVNIVDTTATADTGYYRVYY